MARLRFVTPPNWPDPPQGWLPPADWRPPASWPAPPADWQFYLDAYNYPTPPPLEYWQPWPPVDWEAKLALPVEPPKVGTNVWSSHSDAPVPLKRSLNWPVIVAGLLVIAGLIGAGVWALTRDKDGREPGPIASIDKLYDPPLAVGQGVYQGVGGSNKAEGFEGGGDCVKQANAAVKPARQTAAAMTSRGWTSLSWRFEDKDQAAKAFDGLGQMLTGCTSKSFTFTNPVKGDGFVQFDQSDAKGTAHGKVVLTTDSNVVTWIEGGRDDMGQTAHDAIRKRLSELD